jgi:hypothetical protein
MLFFIFQFYFFWFFLVLKIKKRREAGKMGKERRHVWVLFFKKKNLLN